MTTGWVWWPARRYYYGISLTIIDIDKYALRILNTNFELLYDQYWTLEIRMLKLYRNNVCLGVVHCFFSSKYPEMLSAHLLNRLSSLLVLFATQDDYRFQLQFNGRYTLLELLLDLKQIFNTWATINNKYLKECTT